MNSTHRSRAAPEVAPPLQRYLRTTLLLALLEGGVRVMGAVQQAVYAAMFGATPAYDALAIAQAVPTLAVSLLVVGPLGVAVIPALLRGDVDRRGLVGRTLSVVLIGGVVVVVAGVVLAPLYVRVVGSGLTPPFQDEAVMLLRLGLPIVAAAGVNAVLRSVSHAQGWFLIPSTAFLLSSLSTIGVVLAFGQWLGLALVPLALLAGSLLAIAVQTGVLLRRRAPLSLLPPVVPPVIRQALSSALLLGVAMALVQVNTFWARSLASQVGPGQVALLEYGVGFDRAIGGLTVASAGAAVYPMLALAAATSPDAMAAAVRRALRMALLASLGAATLVIALRDPLVALWLVRGKFGPEQANALTALLPLLGPAYVGWALATPLLYCCHTLGSLRPPVLLTAAVSVAGATCGWLLLPAFGLTAVAATLSGTVVGAVLLLLAFVRWRVPGLSTASGAVFAARCLVAACCAGLAGAAVMVSTSPVVNVVLGGGASALIYIAALCLLGVEEAQMGVEGLLGRLRR